MRSERVALVHDFLLDLRGAERVFGALCDMYPAADVFTAVYDEKGTRGRFADRDVQATFLQRLHPNARTFRALLPFYPLATESMDLRGYDLVISSSSAWAHGVIPDPEAVHVCYCHNPFRYAWNAREETLAAQPALVRAALAVVLSRWRMWDVIAAQRVDAYAANSETTRRRVSRYFGRDATVVAPPVEVERFGAAAGDAAARQGDGYVVLSELMRHKHIDVAIEACNALREPLLIIGNGPDERRLRRLAGPTVRFAGRLDDASVAAELARSRALIVTATEEFGIAAVEAQAAGRPVVALRAGGATETVIEGETGWFFDAPEADALAHVLRAADPASIDPRRCRTNAKRYDVSRFREEMLDVVAGAKAAAEVGAARPRPARRPRGLALSA